MCPNESDYIDSCCQNTNVLRPSMRLKPSHETMLKFTQGFCALAKSSPSKFTHAVRTIATTSISKDRSSAPKVDAQDAETGAIIQINDMQSDEEVVSEKYGSITVISLNRPKQLNAISKAMAAKLSDAILTFENDETASVGILHGVGGNFSCGHDLEELREDVNDAARFLGDDGFAGPTRRIIKKPTICGISGLCMSAGFELALMCDLRIAETTAVFGLADNRKYGIPLMDGGTARLPAIVGMSRALDIILTGRDLKATEALEMGLINRLVAPGSALGQAVNLATCLAKFPQATLNHDRHSMYASIYGQGLEQLKTSEVMAFSKDVLTDMARGLDEGNDGQQFLKSFMPDWEKAEFSNEKEATKKRKHKNPDES